MGNACRVSAVDYTSDDESYSSIDHRWIIVLQANGEAMKLDQSRRRLRAGDLMRQHPDHFLCLASSILIRRKSKMIPAKATLQPGKIYLLLPLPDRKEEEKQQEQQEQYQEQDEADTTSAPLLATAPAANRADGTTKFVISKHYLDKILSESKRGGGSGGGLRNSYSSTTSSSSCSSNPSSIRRGGSVAQRRISSRRRSVESGSVQRRSIVWSPALDSIPEK